MNIFTWALELTRFIPLISVMGYAAWKDYKTGSVPNKIWLYSIFGGILTVIQLIYLFSLPFLAINLVFMLGAVGFAFLIFIVGSGGADSKALITLGVSAPLVPIWSILWPMPLPFLTFFIGSVLCLPLLLTKKSSEPFWKRSIRFLPFMFIGLIISVIL